MERQVVLLLPKTALGMPDTFRLALDRLDTSDMKKIATRREIKVNADLACYTKEWLPDCALVCCNLIRKAYLCYMSL